MSDTATRVIVETPVIGRIGLYTVKRYMANRPQAFEFWLLRSHTFFVPPEGEK